MLADIIINIALYIPLGMTALLALRRDRNRWLRWSAPLFLGGTLSACIEMAQIFTPSRQCSALDLLNNVIGTGAGVLLGLLFQRVARPVLVRVPDRAALALVFLWGGSLLFPFFPVLSLAVFRQKFLELLHAPLDPVALVTGAVTWFAAGCLLASAQLRPAWLWLMVSLLLIPAQFFITTRQPLPWELAGAIAGTVFFGLSGPRVRRVAWVWLALLLLRGLAPFRFAGPAQPFLWVPFGGFLETSWQSGIEVLAEKAFYYGASIWFLRAALRRWWPAIALNAVVLGAIEIAQKWLPGRTSEITDPLLAVLLGGALWTLRKT